MATKVVFGIFQNQMRLPFNKYRKNQENDEIYWVCIECKKKGVIANWRGTNWDNG